ncbi:MAG TPA: AMP-binding protein [Candidatus Dormibacteraeota bacterium]|nr:AMP-binding protein [Candidatus Dormibacteraeota bacterium]
MEEPAISNIAELFDDGLRRHGEHPSLWFEGRWYGSTELNRAGHGLAGGLRDLGLQPGERVVVTMMNCPEVGISYMGAWTAGLAVVPVLFLLTAEELRMIAEDSGATAIVTTPELLPKVREVAAAVPSLRHVICAGGGAGDGVLDFAELCDTAAVDTPLPVDDGEAAVILYTSGTTGRPKGVMLTHGNLHAMAENVHAAWDPGDGHVGLACLPLSHVYGLSTTLAGTYRRGQAVLMRWFDPTQVLQLIEEHRVTMTALVPAMMVGLLDHPDRPSRDLSSLQFVISGAAPLPLDLLQRFESAFGCTVLQGYGLSESAAQCALNTPQANRPGSVGRPVPGVEVAILGSDGAPLAAGEDGEIAMRGANVMRGYHGMPEESAKTVVDGWLRTGDVGHLDADGFLYVLDRSKDLIIRGGFNIIPRDVEEVLVAHPAVSQAAVIGLPHERLGEVVHAVVVLTPGASATDEELIAHCRERLASYKCPQSLELRGGLPTNSTGKVLKRQLREEHVAAAATAS